MSKMKFVILMMFLFIFAESKGDGVKNFFYEMDSSGFRGTSAFLQVTSQTGEAILKGHIQGKQRQLQKANEEWLYPLASMSKVITGVAAMITFEKKPKEFHPQKFIHEFTGWEETSQIQGPDGETVNITLHQLLTHTSGIGFHLIEHPNQLKNVKLLFKPGTQFGYSIGHRIVGWLLLDFWKEQPEGKTRNFQTLNDVLKWLVFDPLGMTKTVTNSNQLGVQWGVNKLMGEAGDATVTSCGSDITKLGVFALNKGKLPGGNELISAANWEDWAMKNLLPDGNKTTELIQWTSEVWKKATEGTDIMKQHGNYGWNYFGGVYDDKNRFMIGWCGFFSSCLHVHYTLKVAIVFMKRDVKDWHGAKPYLTDADKMKKLVDDLTCSGTINGKSCVMCYQNSKTVEKNESCPVFVEKWKNVWKGNVDYNTEHHVCFNPDFCELESNDQGGEKWSELIVDIEDKDLFL